MRNPSWHRDEIILALDLYFKHDGGRLSKDHPEIIDLSELLNSLPIHSSRPDINKFRNPNGVYMKLMNFRSVDSAYKGKGLSSLSKLDRLIWEEFSHDVSGLNRLAENIKKANVQLSDPNNYIDDDEDIGREGRILYRLHRVRERNSSLVKKAKEIALKKDGTLNCAVCGFNFSRIYGDLGHGYIECHHTKPISEYSDVSETKLSDLVLVCSNCHRMLHRNREALSVNELREIKKQQIFF